MNGSTWLLVKALRHPLIKSATGASLIVIVMSMVLFYTLLGERIVDPAGFAGMSFTYGLCVACFCGYLYEYADLRNRACALPVPVTTRQLADLPLALVLSLAGVLLLIYVGALVISDLAGIEIHWTDAISGLARVFPLMFFMLTLGNWAACDRFQYSAVYALPILAIMEMSDSAYRVSVLMENYITLLSPLLVLLGILALWDAPRRSDAWRRASFLPGPAMLLTMSTREFCPPHRLPWYSEVSDFLLRMSHTILHVLITVLASTYLLLEFDTDYDVPAWVVRIIAVLGGFYVLVFGLILCGRAAYLRVQSGTLAVETPLAQRILQLVNLSDRSSQGTFSRTYRCATCRTYLPRWSTCCGETAQPETGPPPATIPPYIAQRHQVLYLLGCLLLGGILVNFSLVRVALHREGSGLQGDPVSSPMVHSLRDDTASFTQHYVALRAANDNLAGAIDPSALQHYLAEHPDPADWLEGLVTLDGTAPTVPERYRIEITQRHSGTVVIQSIGLRWDSAGSLAYALAQRFMENPGESPPLAIDADYEFGRLIDGPFLARGFLDNRVHWYKRDRDHNGYPEMVEYEPKRPTVIAVSQ